MIIQGLRTQNTRFRGHYSEFGKLANYTNLAKVAIERDGYFSRKTRICHEKTGSIISQDYFENKNYIHQIVHISTTEENLYIDRHVEKETGAIKTTIKKKSKN